MNAADLAALTFLTSGMNLSADMGVGVFAAMRSEVTRRWGDAPRAADKKRARVSTLRAIASAETSDLAQVLAVVCA